ncbi:TPA: hypothetical protein LU109_003584 [Enterobacter hormaechei subsp. xiangfangensis]|nr:hypothetical protein [Enterobacter hormaechei subsp. xiangfangensis]
MCKATKEYQEALLRAAASDIASAIANLENLIQQYGDDPSQVSACSAKAGHASTTRQLRKLHKSLSKGRV